MCLSIYISCITSASHSSTPPTSPLAPHDRGGEAHGGWSALQHLDHLQGGGHGLRRAALVVKRRPRRGGGGGGRQCTKRRLHRRRVPAACACVALKGSSSYFTYIHAHIACTSTALAFAVRHPSPHDSPVCEPYATRSATRQIHRHPLITNAFDSPLSVRRHGAVRRETRTLIGSQEGTRRTVMQRVATLMVTARDVRPAPQQRASQPHVAPPARRHERRDAVHVRHVRRRPAVKQQLGRVLLAAVRRHVQRRATLRLRVRPGLTG